MNSQTFSLSWIGQSSISSTRQRVGQGITKIFSNILRRIFTLKKDEEWLDSIELARQSASHMRMVPLPVGYLNRACPECRSDNLIGALLSPEADESDPNVFCRSCSWVN